MKNYYLISFFILSLLNFKAQDTIVFHSGKKIEAKVLEIGPINIKYKKYNNLNGPTYLTEKKEISSIKYSNQTEDFFGLKEDAKEDTVKLNFRKGSYAGIHIASGLDPSTANRRVPRFGLNSGLDYYYFFNKNLAIKTGITSLYFEDPVFSLVGIPLKFVFTTNGKIGFYSEFGFTAYFSAESGSKTNILSSISSPSLGIEPVVGINVKASKKINLNLGMKSIIASGEYYSGLILFGAQFGLIYKL